MEIDQAQPERIPLRRNEEPERGERRFRCKWSVNLALYFGRKASRRVPDLACGPAGVGCAFGARRSGSPRFAGRIRDELDFDLCRSAVILISRGAAVQRKSGQALALQSPRDDPLEAVGIELAGNPGDVNGVVRVEIVPLQHAQLKGIQLAGHSLETMISGGRLATAPRSRQRNFNGLIQWVRILVFFQNHHHWQLERGHSCPLP